MPRSLPPRRSNSTKRLNKRPSSRCLLLTFGVGVAGIRLAGIASDQSRQSVSQGWGGDVDSRYREDLEVDIGCSLVGDHHRPAILADAT